MRLKQCLHQKLLAFPENAKLHSSISITAQLVAGLPAAAIRNRLLYPSYLSPAYSMFTFRIKIKYPNIFGTLCSCFLHTTEI